MEWVVGFLMDEAAERVVLIRKARPEWQAGKLNGVGGKVEPGELPAPAMRREFHEETGVLYGLWQPFARLRWEEGTVHFYRAFASRSLLSSCHTTTDEPIEVHTVHSLLHPGREDVIPNLRWLVPLAAHRHDQYDVIDVAEKGTTLRKPGRLEVLGSAS